MERKRKNEMLENICSFIRSVEDVDELAAIRSAVRVAQANVKRQEMENLVDFLYASHRWLVTKRECPSEEEVAGFQTEWVHFVGRSFETDNITDREKSATACVEYIKGQAQCFHRAIMVGMEPDDGGQIHIRAKKQLVMM